MKKLLSLLLIAVLMLSLSISALAYEDLTPPLWQRLGYDSLEAYLEDFDETEEEYAAWVAELLANRAEEDRLIASYDPTAHDFTPPLWQYYGYASRAEMLQAWEIDEAGYLQAVDAELFAYQARDWTAEQWDAWYEENWSVDLQAEKEALGLYYDVNIMVDGVPMEFPKAAPIIHKNCVMAPLRLIAEAMQATQSFEYSTGAIRITRGDRSVELTLGGRAMGANAKAAGGGQTRSVTYLETRPFMKDREIYVPVRAVAEALGYEVEWSDAYRTAVLLDVDAAIERLDKSFTVLNAVLAMNAQIDRTQGYRSRSELNFRLHIPELGDTTCAVSVGAAVVQNGQAVQGTVRFDLGNLPELLARLSEDGEIEDSGVLDVLNVVQADGMELILDLDSGKLYFRGAFLAVASGAEAPAADAWYAIDLSEFTDPIGTDTLYALSQGTMSVGRLICMLAGQDGVDPIYLMESLDEAAQALAFLDDSHFTAVDGVRHLDIALPDGDAGAVSLDVTMAGSRAMKLEGSIRYGESGIKLDCTFTCTPQSTVVSGSFCAEDAIRAEFSVTSQGEAAPGVAVPTAPPAGAAVIDLFGMLIGSVLDGADLSAMSFAA